MQKQVISEADVLYEDNHLIAIQKKAGTLVQGDKSGDVALSESLAEFLKKKYKKPGNVFVGVIHRIDRPVSGMVLFAKTSKGLSRMNEVFKKREVRKIYLAIVEGKVDQPEGTLEGFLVRNRKQNKSYPSNEKNKEAKKVKLSFRLLQHLDNYSVLLVNPETGRHHQIRSQLSAMGHPIKGDLKYGSKRSNPDGSISLHARSLEFIQPMKKEDVKITSPLPDSDIWTAVDPN